MRSISFALALALALSLLESALVLRVVLSEIARLWTIAATTDMVGALSLQVLGNLGLSWGSLLLGLVAATPRTFARHRSTELSMRNN